MADTSNLSKFLGDIAEAIRTKKETVDTIPAKDFDTEILSIETGINTADATATADNIENGYTAYVNGEKISGTIATSLDTIITAGADATITDTGEALNVDRGYGEKLILKSEQQLRSSIPYATIANIAGLTPEKLMKGEIVLGVEGTAEGGGAAEINNQDKTITENGTYTADEGYTGLGEVTVNVQAEGIKQFNTIENMQKDTTAEEGELALVYGVQTKPISTAIITMGTTVYFPSTVILDEAITETYSSNVDIYPDTLTIALSPTVFTMSVKNRLGQSSNKASYTSTNGKTYTRTSTAESYTFTSNYTSSANFERVDGWEYMRNFLCTMSNYFGGLFDYRTDRDNNYIELYGNVSVTSSKRTADITNVEIAPLKQIVDKIYNELKTTKLYTVVKNSTGLYLYKYPDGGIPGIIVYGSDYYRISQDYTSSPKASVDKYTINLENMTYTKTTLSALSTKYEYQTIYETIPTSSLIGMINFTTSSNTLSLFGHNSSTSTSTYPMLNTNCVNTAMTYGEFTQYFPVESQLSDVTPADIYPNKTVFGGNGVVTGDGSLEDNIPLDMLQRMVFQGGIETGDRATGVYTGNTPICTTNTTLGSLTNSPVVPIKLSPYTYEGKNVAFFNKATPHVYSRDLTKRVEFNISTGEIYIKDDKTNELLITYSNLNLGAKFDIFKVFLISDEYMVYYIPGSPTRVYKFSVLTEDIGVWERTYDSDKTVTTTVSTCNACLNKFYIYGTTDDTTNDVCVYWLGYVDLNTMSYVSIIEESIAYYSTAYTPSCGITNAQDLIIKWEIYGESGSAKYSPRYWVYLIDKNDNIVNSIENSATNPNVSISYYASGNEQYINYDPGDGYIYNGTKRLNKSTLIGESCESIGGPSAAPFDFSFAYRRNYTTYEWKIWYGEDYSETTIVTGWEPGNIYTIDKSITTSITLRKVGDEFKIISGNSNCEPIGGYDFEISTIDDCDAILFRPTLIDSSGAEQRTYKFKFVSALTQSDYNVALDTADEILGEEV